MARIHNGVSAATARINGRREQSTQTVDSIPPTAQSHLLRGPPPIDLAAGDESDIADRLRRFEDAGATDLAVRVLPLGGDRAARIASRERTESFLADLCPEL